MSKIEKETMKKLDGINCLWLLKQLSVGNFVRGLAYISTFFEKVKTCVKEGGKSAKEGDSVEEEAKKKKK
jgi:hypothetical protein